MQVKISMDAVEIESTFGIPLIVAETLEHRNVECSYVDFTRNRVLIEGVGYELELGDKIQDVSKLVDTSALPWL